MARTRKQTRFKNGVTVHEYDGVFSISQHDTWCTGAFESQLAASTSAEFLMDRLEALRDYALVDNQNGLITEHLVERVLLKDSSFDLNIHPEFGEVTRTMREIEGESFEITHGVLQRPQDSLHYKAILRELAVYQHTLLE